MFVDILIVVNISVSAMTAGVSRFIAELWVRAGPVRFLISCCSCGMSGRSGRAMTMPRIAP